MSATILTNRFIGFFDILGFSHRLENRSPSDVHTELLRLLSLAKESVFSAVTASVAGKAAERQNKFDYSQFLFDSFVLVSRDDSQQGNSSDFFLSAIYLMSAAFAIGMPLRGAIAYGDFLLNKEEDIFLSKAFPSLVRAEKQQNWSGCVVTESALNAMLRSVSIIDQSGKKIPAEAALIPYVVPLKTEKSSTSMWCLNWVHLMADAEIATGQSFLIEPKRTNTSAFIKHVRQLPTSSINFDDPAGALKVDFLKTQSSLSMSFRNAEGIAVDPTAEVELIVLQNNDIILRPRVR